MILLLEYNFWILDPPVVSTPTRWCLPYHEGGRGKKQKEVHLRDTLFSLLLFFAWDSGCFPFSDPDKLVTKWSWQKKLKVDSQLKSSGTTFSFLFPFLWGCWNIVFSFLSYIHFGCFNYFCDIFELVTLFEGIPTLRISKWNWTKYI